MADTKISALADVVTLAAGDKVPVADASDLTVSKSATMTELKTFMRPTIITGSSGTVDQSDIGSQTFQILTSANTDIPTTTLVAQLTAQTMGVGWWHVQYWIIWQSNVTTTGITFTIDHSGTAVNSQYTRQDRTSSATALATVGVADQDSPTSAGVGWLPSNWSVRADNTALGPNAGVDTINVNQLTYIDGLLLVTASGNLVLQAASEVASTVTRVSQGTYAVYTRLS